MSSSRWLFAALVGLAVHGMVFVLPWSEPVTRPPKPKGVQRIAVSLGEKKTEVKQEKPKPPEQKKRSVIPKPEPKAKPNPKPKKQVKPQPVVTPVEKPPSSIVTEPPPSTQVQIEQVNTQDSKGTGEPKEMPETGSQETAGLIEQAAPLYQINPPPKYPRIARRRGLQGMVLLDVLINTTGGVDDLRLSRSSGHGVLDRAAVQAVRKWRFNVGTVAGVPTQMWVKVPVRFRLQ